eukprot:1257439-Alexandrium_andersonii.AAC.1
MSQERVTTASWWAIYKDIAGLVVDTPSIERILAETTSWRHVQQELSLVTSTCRIGMKMFGWALQHVVSEKLADNIAARLRSVATPITKEVAIGSRQ